MMIGNMGDVATLTDRLATMPDNMLPRLAQQYKTDAVTLSLILSEKNRRDRVRQSFQAQAGAQPQPKVNDQIVANMQQPSPGIAGLPAPTMQGMADGGIAGYAEGGEVEGYAGGGRIPRYAGVPEFGSVVRSGVTNPNAAFLEFLKQMGVSTQDFIQSSPQAQTALREMFETGATAATQAAPAAATTAAQAAPAAAAQAAPAATAQTAAPAAKAATTSSGLRALGSKFMPTLGRALGWGQVATYSPELNQDENAWLSKRSTLEAVFPPSKDYANAPPEELARAAADPRVSPKAFKKLMADYAARRAKEQGESPAEDKKSTQSAGTKGDAAANAGTGAGAKASAKASAGAKTAAQGSGAPVNDPFSIESLRAEQEAAMRPLQLQQGELRNQMTGLRSQMEGQAEGALSRRRKEIEEEGDLYAGRMERIKAREADLLKQKDTNMGLALLNAGLAIMSTPGSLGTAIGKGARVGTEQYAAGLDKLRAAQERLEEAKDRTEDLRMNRSDMNKREIRQMERDRDAAYLAGSKLFYDFTNSVYNMDRQDTNALLASAAKGREMKFEQQGRERVAQIQTGPQYARNEILAKQIAEKAGEDAKVRKEFLQVQKMVDAELRTDMTYLMETDPVKKQQKYQATLNAKLAANPFLASYVFTKQPTGQVYDLTEAE